MQDNYGNLRDIHPQLIYKSFGTENPDKRFMLIRQAGRGRGLFSLLSAVICWVDLAKKNNLIPIVDFENHTCEYNESIEINGLKNAFEYYFEPLSQYELKEIYASKHVFLTDDKYPSGYNYNISKVSGLLTVYKDYFRVKKDILSEVNSINVRNLIGIHYRGQEMRHAVGHWLPPSQKQIFYAIDSILSYIKSDGIYVCTEDQRLLESIKRRYGSLVIYRDHFRTSGRNAYKISYPRVNHKYHLGKEILIDALTLAKCSSFIGCTTNVAAFTRFLNDNKFKIDIKIDNGPNSWVRPFNYIRWPLAAILPPNMGGFKLDNKTIVFTKAQI